MKKHQNCLVTIEKESGGIIPMSMLKLVKEGQQGLFNYEQVMQHIQTILNKNKLLASLLIRYQSSLHSYDLKLKGLDKDYKKLQADV